MKAHARRSQHLTAFLFLDLPHGVETIRSTKKGKNTTQRGGENTQRCIVPYNEILSTKKAEAFTIMQLSAHQVTHHINKGQKWPDQGYNVFAESLSFSISLVFYLYGTNVLPTFQDI